MVVGFKHTVREAWQGRAKISQPGDDKWPFSPPVVGEVLGRNMEVLAVVEEEPHKNNEDQFEFHNIRAPDCSRAELGADEDLCPKCKSIYELVKRRMESTVDLRQVEFNPKTNRLRRYRQILGWSLVRLNGAVAIPEQRQVKLQLVTFLHQLRKIRLL